MTVVYGHKPVYNARKSRYSDMMTPIGNFLEPIDDFNTFTWIS